MWRQEDLVIQTLKKFNAEPCDVYAITWHLNSQGKRKHKVKTIAAVLSRLSAAGKIKRVYRGHYMAI